MDPVLEQFLVLNVTVPFTSGLFKLSCSLDGNKLWAIRAIIRSDNAPIFLRQLFVGFE